MTDRVFRDAAARFADRFSEKVDPDVTVYDMGPDYPPLELPEGCHQAMWVAPTALVPGYWQYFGGVAREARPIPIVDIINRDGSSAMDEYT